MLTSWIGFERAKILLHQPPLMISPAMMELIFRSRFKDGGKEVSIVLLDSGVPAWRRVVDSDLIHAGDGFCVAAYRGRSFRLTSFPLQVIFNYDFSS